MDNICHDLDNQVAKYVQKNKGKISGVYAYEDCALKTFSTAKNNAIKCIYDLPIGYWRSMRSLLNEEQTKIQNGQLHLEDSMTQTRNYKEKTKNYNWRIKSM